MIRLRSRDCTKLNVRHYSVFEKEPKQKDRSQHALMRCGLCTHHDDVYRRLGICILFRAQLCTSLAFLVAAPHAEVDGA
jgi:ribosomal protein S14